jgi:hypothetical protein
MNIWSSRIDHEKIGIYAPTFCFLKKLSFDDENMVQTQHEMRVFLTIFAVFEYFSPRNLFFSGMTNVNLFVLVFIMRAIFF